MGPIRFATIIVTGLALSLTACGSNENTDEASAEYCQSSQALATELRELRDLVAGGSGTLEDMEDQRSEVRAAYATMLEDADELAESLADDISEANQGFEDAIQDIPDDATIDEAAAAYNSAATAYNDELGRDPYRGRLLKLGLLLDRGRWPPDHDARPAVPKS